MWRRIQALSPRRHLRAQLLLTTLLPLLLVTVLLTWSVIELRRSQLMEQARLRTVQAGRASALFIAERLSIAEVLTRLLADQPTLTRVLVQGDAAALHDVVQQTRESTLFDLVTVVDPAGAVIAQDGDSALWRSPARMEQASLVWGHPVVGMVAEVDAPIMIDQRQAGTLIGAFAVGETFLEGAYQRSGLDQSLFVDDTLVASSLPARTTTAPHRLIPDNAQELPDHLLTEREVLVGGVPYLVYYEPVLSHADVPLGTIEVLLPLAPVQQAQYQTTLTILGGVALALGVALGLTWLLTKAISRSIDTLGHAARQIGAGDLAQPVVVHGAVEITRLSTAIDQMRTQLQATHRALAAETARYLNILESAHDAMLVLTSDGRISLMNRGAEALLGCQRTSATGLPLAEVVQLHSGEHLSLDHIPVTGSTNLAIQTGDGRVLTVAATRAAIRAGSDEQPGEQIVVLRDVSEAVALSALKDAFLANVTHEFRTPLAALIASLEILQNEHGDLSPSEQQQMLAAVHIGVRRLDTLVQNLLDSASIQAGYFRVEPEATRLGPLVEEAVELIRPLVQQRAQTIAVDLPADLPPVLADDRRIVQVLVNLISNASKFGPRGDTIQLTVAVQQGSVDVAVTDHGPGIPESRQPGLFERFLRPGSETLGAQGIGLGLAIVKAIVERHGGSIHVSTDPRQGTTFSFSLQIVLLPDVVGMPDREQHAAG